MFFALY